MVFPMAVLKIAAHWWVLSFYRIARKVRSYTLLHRNSSSSSSSSHARSQQVITSVTTNCELEGSVDHGQTFASCTSDFFESLLKSSSPFPYFMLVAFEGGSLLRALLLLLSYPLLFILGSNKDLTLKIMVFITFCGLKTKDVDIVARAVLPKFYLENMHDQLHAHHDEPKPALLFTNFPRVMVEWFLTEYLNVSEVLGPELHIIRGSYFSGLITKEEYYCRPRSVMIMPRNKNINPKPLVFHDGRLAFFPTPLATLSLFLWLPLGIPLAITRVLIGTLLPYKASLIQCSFTGIRLRVINPPTTTTTTNNNNNNKNNNKNQRNGVLYVCTHRTLLDPVMLSTALARPVPAVTYSLSRMSEIIAPMRTIRLTRDRLKDSETMKRLLKEGDLIVCPEGTTCREPYLLRFSSLFAELAEEIVPVAVDARVSMFYGTTASGFKWLDPLFFMMNPWPEYSLELLGKVPRDMTCAGGGWSAAEVANRIQRQLAGALGFECTVLTRRDKYLMLVGNEGVVREVDAKKI